MSFHGKRVLVVDDEPELVEILCSRLSGWGIHTISASNGLEAVDLAIREKPDLVLSDVRMPNGDGFHLLDSLIRLGEDRPKIIFISTFSESLKIQALQRGALDCLDKPIDEEALTKALTVAFGLSGN